LKNLNQLLLNLRVWLLLKRCESLIQSYGFKAYDDMSMVAFSNDEQQAFFAKLDKNRLFIELKRQERMFIVNSKTFSNKNYQLHIKQRFLFILNPFKAHHGSHKRSAETGRGRR
jgi:hypothetical protein